LKEKKTGETRRPKEFGKFEIEKGLRKKLEAKRIKCLDA